MRERVRAALAIWQARNPRTVGDRAYTAYVVIMVAAVVGMPALGLIWESATSVGGTTPLRAGIAPTVTSLIAAALWAGALLLGRERGPALFPPFPLHALASSALPRSVVFRGPVLRAGMLLTGSTVAIAAFIGASLASQGFADVHPSAAFILGAAATGVMTTVAWLVGQVFPRTAIPMALGIGIAAGMGQLIPAVQSFLPWTWLGATYPGSASPLTPLALLVTLAITAMVMVPRLLNALSFTRLSAQSARWRSATSHAIGLEFAAATAIYQSKPYLGRSVRAVQPVSNLAAAFVIRDAIGAARTPGRLILGVTAMAASGVLIAVALSPAVPTELLGAAVGVTLFVALGPVTDGIRYAVHVAAGDPLFGVSDGHLLSLHALFPVLTCLLVVLLSAAIGALLYQVAVGVSLTCAFLVAASALMARISAAMKGWLPPALLTPIPTPMGDMNVVMQFAWALDGLIVMGLAGGAAMLFPQAPLPSVIIIVFLAAVAGRRWRQLR